MQILYSCIMTEKKYTWLNIYTPYMSTWMYKILVQEQVTEIA